MAEDLIIDKQLDRESAYQQLLPQIKALLDGETDLIANCANAVAALKETFDFFWVGVYFLKENQLVLGPFQGPIACTRIDFGKGVCGKVWEQNRTLIVEDVEQFPGHIACSALSKSEIVLPGRNKSGDVAFVLDIDSDRLADFNETDEQYLSQIVALLEKSL